MCMGNRIVTGIGSRNIPIDMIQVIKYISGQLLNEDAILRSGGARGADTAFEIEYREKNRESLLEIYLPSNGGSNPINNRFDCTTFPNWNDAMSMAEYYHPGWKRLGSFAKALMARNCYQVLGKDLNTPSSYVVCWTPDGSDGSTTTKLTGGTGQALRIAYDYKIPIINLAIHTNIASDLLI